MRPLELKMTAFGPYSTHEVINFTELRDNNLFLITGPTGSGKTTIFDGICLAMYGESSGNIRKSEHLRSQFADDNTLTEIELIFKLKDNTYKINRIPMQERKKKKSEGYTTQKPEATLIINPGNSEKVITGVSNVNKEIESIMGINAEQFRQIMMIPQGDFRKLLLASSEEREDVLKKLFDTTIYQNLQYRLDEQAKTIYRSIKGYQEIRNHEIEKINPSDDVSFAELINNEYKNVPEIVNLLNQSIKKDQNLFDNYVKQIVDINKNKENIVEKIGKANAVNKQFEQLEELKEKLGLKIEQREDIIVLKEKVTLGKKALMIAPIEENLIHNKEMLDEQSKALDKNNIIFENIIKELDQAQRIYDELSSDSQRLKREELSKSLNTLELLIDKVNQINGIEKDIKEHEASKKKNNDNMNTLVKELDLLKEQIKIAEEEQKRLSDDVVSDDALKSLAKQNELQLENVKYMNTFESDINKLNTQIQKVEEESVDLDNKAQKTQEAYNTHRDHYMSNLSGVLAAELTDGEACPVCGSFDHPQVAQPNSEQISYDQVIEFQKINDHTQMAFNNNKNELKHLNSQLDDVVKKYRNYRLDLVNRDILTKAESETDNLQSVIDEKVIQHQNEDKNIQEKIELNQLTQKKIDNNANQLIEMNKSIELKQQDIDSIKEKIVVSEGEIKNLQGSLTMIYSEVPEDLRTPSFLNEKIEEAKVVKEKAYNEYEDSRKGYEDLKSEKSGVEAAIKQIEVQVNELTASVNKLENHFNEQVVQAGFEDTNDYKKAKYDQSMIENDIQTIEAYEVAVQSLKNQIKAMEESLVNQKPQDISVLEEEIDKLQKDLDEIEKLKNIIDKRLDQNSKIERQINIINNEISAQEERYGIIGNLAKVAMGKNLKNISFVRYVLSSFLEDILNSANIRLKQMTQGRYQLVITDEKERKDSRSGLDLGVFDEWTGKERHVKTLSGGESFKASLAMALGLSDVVQSYAGGVQLDTMFIDEGFGTLDQESLDSAIGCLVELKNKGRLVGIISHVQELKERINVRLDVKTQNGGSSTAFYIG